MARLWTQEDIKDSIDAGDISVFFGDYVFFDDKYQVVLIGVEQNIFSHTPTKWKPVQYKFITSFGITDDAYEKDKSVIGRAAVGGLALGPIGAVVGGMSGIGTKSRCTYLGLDFWFNDYTGKSLEMETNYIQVDLINNELGGYKTSSEKYRKLRSLADGIEKKMAEIFKMLDQEERNEALRSAISDGLANSNPPQIEASDNKTKQVESTVVEVVESAPSIDKADQILKFKNLLDMGAITQEEFETEKRRILSS